MSAAHLGDESVRNIVCAELATLFCDHRVKQHLQEQIAELFAHQRRAAVPDGLIELVRFFNEIWSQRLVSLRRVPLATAS
jgi:hypothetical protein